MTDTKWTKGPWEIERLSDGCVGIIGDARSVSDDEEHCTQVVEFQMMGEANAHLIAAAPELYEALDTLLHAAANDYGVTASTLDDARDALAKARGES